MSFIQDDFLLSNAPARRLYNDYAKNEPVLDYHCHLPTQNIAENRQFNNLFEIWLEGDHYKWRAMRSNGVPERFCTGAAAPFEKFKAWAATVPHTIRNPLYHWTHIELKRYFGIDELLNEKTAESIWNRANEQLARPDFRVHGIFKKFKVMAVCTTDDPVDSLEHHKAIARSGLETRVFPTFRPDKALTVHQPENFNAWVNKLEAAANVSIRTLPHLVDAVSRRHEYFHSLGCRLSDHGLERCYASFCTDAEAAAIFDKARSGKAATMEEQDKFATFMMLLFGRLDAEKGWTKQLHVGALRNNNTRLMKKLGPDTGFDSIGDFPQGSTLAAYLDRLDQDNVLPKTILYNLNPADNCLMATMLGNFQDGTIPGKIQFGSGWWFLDQKDGMEQQINTLSNLGLLSRFVGMLTDSRSFMSYCRHEYFRRTLCNLIGRDIENGEIPDDDTLVGPMIRNICFQNARDYLKLF
jgi:glucuronate isomerase